MSRTPTLAEVMRAALDARLGDVHTAIPGKVTRYDASKCLVDAAPLIRAPQVGEDGETTYEPLPVVPNVPILFPGSGAVRLTWPVQVGDTVLLVFSEASLERWLQFGGEVDPEDPRRFALSDAFAIPGLVPFASARAASTAAVVVDTDGKELRLGTDTAGEALALASKVATELGKLRSAYDAHTHTIPALTSPNAVPVVPGPVVTTPGVTLAGPTAAAAASTASARVKADS